MPSKPELRTGFRAILQNLVPSEREHASLILRERLRAWPVFQQAPVIAIYAATLTEPDLDPLNQLEASKHFVYPRCGPDRQLSWHRPRPGEWKVSRFGIREPVPSPDSEMDPGDIQLVLVPGLAFTPGGDRLGHGAGYYDRFLASLPTGIPTAGICFSCQMVEKLPVEEHDIPVHHVFHA